MADGADHDGTMLSAVSNEMVPLYKTQLGRGPTKVRTDSTWAGLLLPGLLFRPGATAQGDWAIVLRRPQ
jgi:hypothetical protein